MKAKKKEHEWTKVLTEKDKFGEYDFHICLKCLRKHKHRPGQEFTPRGPICSGKPIPKAAAYMRNRKALKNTARRMLDETCRDRRLKKRLRKQGVKVTGRVKAAKR